MAKQFIKKNERRIVIDTPTGPRAFSGMSKTWHEKTLKICAQGKNLRVGLKHIFLCEAGWKLADQLTYDDILIGENNTFFQIDSIIEGEGEFLYDFLDVDGGSAYIADGLISHNCEFLSSDALLINSMVTQKMRSTAPVYEDMGFKFWRKPEDIGGAGKTYLVGIDPATGTGNDFSSIEVFEFPSMFQVAEWRSNALNIPMLYAKIKWILELLSQPRGRGRAEVLWTFERNGIGEAVAALLFNDEKQLEHPELLSDRADRLGVFTTKSTKIQLCLQLKQLIESVSSKMTINSEALIFEMKNFVAKNGGYEAKSGATDDSMMATIQVVRLLKRLAEYNDEAFKQVNHYTSPVETEEVFTTPEDDFGDDPVPFAIV